MKRHRRVISTTQNESFIVKLFYFPTAGSMVPYLFVQRPLDYYSEFKKQ